MEMLFLCDRWVESLPEFYSEGDQIISKTYMTRVEGENTRVRHPAGSAQTKNYLLF